MRGVSLPARPSQRPLTIASGVSKTKKGPIPMRADTPALTKPGGRREAESGIMRTRAQIHESQITYKEGLTCVFAGGSALIPMPPPISGGHRPSSFVTDGNAEFFLKTGLFSWTLRSGRDTLYVEFGRCQCAESAQVAPVD